MSDIKLLVSVFAVIVVAIAAWAWTASGVLEAEPDMPTRMTTKSMGHCLDAYKEIHGKDDAFTECVDILQGLRAL